MTEWMNELASLVFFLCFFYFWECKSSKENNSFIVTLLFFRPTSSELLKHKFFQKAKVGAKSATQWVSDTSVSGWWVKVWAGRRDQSEWPQFYLFLKWMCSLWLVLVWMFIALELIEWGFKCRKKRSNITHQENKSMTSLLLKCLCESGYFSLGSTCQCVWPKLRPLQHSSHYWPCRAVSNKRQG